MEPGIIDLPRLRASVERHEGRRRRAYHDTEGVLTTGIGHNLEVDLLRKTWTDNEIDRLFADDIAVSCAGAKALVSREAWALMGAERREVLVEMVFQLGCAGVGNFRRFREALEACDYEWAAGEMLWRKWRRGLPSVRRSLWRIQTPARCERLAEIMRTGHISQGGNT